MRYASLFNGEALGAAASGGVAPPSVLASQLGVLLWRVSLAAGAGSTAATADACSSGVVCMQPARHQCLRACQ
jgi:hypothetical protein